MSHSRNKFAEMKDSEARFDGSGYISVDPTDFYTEGQTSSISLRKPTISFSVKMKINHLLDTFYFGGNFCAIY
mgnify:CR=1 FL=1